MILAAIIVLFSLAQNWLMGREERKERRAAKKAKA